MQSCDQYGHTLIFERHLEKVASQRSGLFFVRATSELRGPLVAQNDHFDASVTQRNAIRWQAHRSRTSAARRVSLFIAAVVVEQMAKLL